MAEKVNENIFFYYTLFSLVTTDIINDLISFVKKSGESHCYNQLLNPQLIVSKRQLKVAIYQTMTAIRKNLTIATDNGIELLIRLSGEKQINKALRYFGVNKSTEKIILVSFGENKDKCYSSHQEIIKRFDIKKNIIENYTFPLIPLSKLAEYYRCDSDIEIVEKAAIEKIASVEIEKV